MTGDRIVLESIARPAVRFAVGDGQTVGGAPNQREGHVADVVIGGIPEIDFVSGTHARFSRRSGTWFLENLTQTNWCSLNGLRVGGAGESAPLEDGDILYLTFCGFRVSIPAAPGTENRTAAPGR